MLTFFNLADCMFKCFLNLQIIENGMQQTRRSGEIENFYYMSLTNYLQVEFTSDITITRKGFEAIYFSGKNIVDEM